VTSVGIACRVLSGALAIAIAPACSKFGEDAPLAPEAGVLDGSEDGGPAACREACSAAIPFCQTWDFTAGCPPELTTAGDSDPKNAFHECNGGTLRVFAANTLDYSVMLSTKTPSKAYRAHVAATATLAEWSGSNGCAVIQVVTAGGSLARITAESATTTLIYSLCVGQNRDDLVCAKETVSAPKGTAHRLALDVDSNGRVAFSFDCKEVASTLATATTLATASTLKLRFGDVDGSPIDGQLDDVIIALPLL